MKPLSHRLGPLGVDTYEMNIIWIHLAAAFCITTMAFASKYSAEDVAYTDLIESFDTSLRSDGCHTKNCRSELKNSGEELVRDMITEFIESNKEKRKNNEPNVFDLLKLLSSLVSSDINEDATEIIVNLHNTENGFKTPEDTNHNTHKEKAPVREKREILDSINKPQNEDKSNILNKKFKHINDPKVDDGNFANKSPIVLENNQNSDDTKAKKVKPIPKRNSNKNMNENGSKNAKKSNKVYARNADVDNFQNGDVVDNFDSSTNDTTTAPVNSKGETSLDSYVSDTNADNSINVHTADSNNIRSKVNEQVSDNRSSIIEQTQYKSNTDNVSSSLKSKPDYFVSSYSTNQPFEIDSNENINSKLESVREFDDAQSILQNDNLIDKSHLKESSKIKENFTIILKPTHYVNSTELESDTIRRNTTENFNSIEVNTLVSQSLRNNSSSEDTLDRSVLQPSGNSESFPNSNSVNFRITEPKKLKKTYSSPTNGLNINVEDVSDNFNKENQSEVNIPLSTKQLNNLQTVLHENFGVHSHNSQPIANFSLNKTHSKDKPVVVMVFNCDCHKNKINSQINDYDADTITSSRRFNSESNNEFKVDVDSKNGVKNTQITTNDSDVKSEDTSSKNFIDKTAQEMNKSVNIISSNTLLENMLLSQCQSLLAAQKKNENVNPADKVKSNKESSEVNVLTEGNPSDFEITGFNPVNTSVLNYDSGKEDNSNVELTRKNIVQYNNDPENKKETQNGEIDLQTNNQGVYNVGQFTNLKNNEGDNLSRDSLNINVNSNIQELESEVTAEENVNKKVQGSYPSQNAANNSQTSTKRTQENQEQIYRKKRDIMGQMNEALTNMVEVPANGLSTLLSILFNSDLGFHNRTKRQVRTNNKPTESHNDSNENNKPIIGVKKMDDKKVTGERHSYTVEQKYEDQTQTLKPIENSENNETSTMKVGDFESDEKLKEVLNLIRPIQINVYLDLMMRKLGKGKDKHRKH